MEICYATCITCYNHQTFCIREILKCLQPLGFFVTGGFFFWKRYSSLLIPLCLLIGDWYMLTKASFSIFLLNIQQFDTVCFFIWHFDKLWTLHNLCNVLWGVCSSLGNGTDPISMASYKGVEITKFCLSDDIMSHCVVSGVLLLRCDGIHFTKRFFTHK